MVHLGLGLFLGDAAEQLKPDDAQFFIVRQFGPGILGQNLVQPGARPGEGRGEAAGPWHRVHIPCSHTQLWILPPFGKKARFSETGNAFGGGLKG